MCVCCVCVFPKIQKTRRLELSVFLFVTFFCTAHFAGLSPLFSFKTNMSDEKEVVCASIGVSLPRLPNVLWSVVASYLEQEDRLNATATNKQIAASFVSAIAWQNGVTVDLDIHAHWPYNHRFWSHLLTRLKSKHLKFMNVKENHRGWSPGPSLSLQMDIQTPAIAAHLCTLEMSVTLAFLREIAECAQPSAQFPNLRHLKLSQTGRMSHQHFPINITTLIETLSSTLETFRLLFYTGQFSMHPTRTLPLLKELNMQVPSFTVVWLHNAPFVCCSESTSTSSISGPMKFTTHAVQVSNQPNPHTWTEWVPGLEKLILDFEEDYEWPCRLPLETLSQLYYLACPLSKHLFRHIPSSLTHVTLTHTEVMMWKVKRFTAPSVQKLVLHKGPDTIPPSLELLTILFPNLCHFETPWTCAFRRDQVYQLNGVWLSKLEAITFYWNESDCVLGDINRFLIQAIKFSAVTPWLMRDIVFSTTAVATSTSTNIHKPNDDKRQRFHLLSMLEALPLNKHLPSLRLICLNNISLHI